MARERKSGHGLEHGCVRGAHRERCRAVDPQADHRCADRPQRHSAMAVNRAGPALQLAYGRRLLVCAGVDGAGAERRGARVPVGQSPAQYDGGHSAAAGGRAGGAEPRRSRSGRESSPPTGRRCRITGGWMQPGTSPHGRCRRGRPLPAHSGAHQRGRCRLPLQTPPTGIALPDRSSPSRVRQARCCDGSPTAPSREVSVGEAGHGSRTRANSEA